MTLGHFWPCTGGMLPLPLTTFKFPRMRWNSSAIVWVHLKWYVLTAQVEQIHTSMDTNVWYLPLLHAPNSVRWMRHSISFIFPSRLCQSSHPYKQMVPSPSFLYTDVQRIRCLSLLVATLTIYMNSSRPLSMQLYRPPCLAKSRAPHEKKREQRKKKLLRLRLDSSVNFLFG